MKFKIVKYAFLIVALVGSVAASAATGSIVEYTVPTANAQPLSMVTGPDGNLWFTEFRGNKIARMTTQGVVEAEFLIPTVNSQPDEIDVGRDGNLWFAEVTGNRIGRITTEGVITEFLVPTPNSRPTVIAPGPDGNLWFTERGTLASPGNKVGRITPEGGDHRVPAPESGQPPARDHRGTRRQRLVHAAGREPRWPH